MQPPRDWLPCSLIFCHQLFTIFPSRPGPLQKDWLFGKQPFVKIWLPRSCLGASTLLPVPSQTPGRIHKVESRTSELQYSCSVNYTTPRWINFLNPRRVLGSALRRTAFRSSRRSGCLQKSGAMTLGIFAGPGKPKTWELWHYTIMLQGMGICKIRAPTIDSENRDLVTRNGALKL